MNLLLPFLILLAPPALGAPGADPGFGLEPAAGWESRKPPPGSLFALGRGPAVLTVNQLAEALSAPETAARMEDDSRSLTRKGRKVGKTVPYRSPAGILYLIAGFGPPGSETLFGYFTVEERSFSYLAKQASRDEVLAMLDTLAPPPLRREKDCAPGTARPCASPGASAEEFPGQRTAPQTPVSFLSGQVTLPRVPGWRVEAPTPEELAVSGPDWTFALSAAAMREMGIGPGKDVQTLAAAYLAQRETRLIDKEGCRGRDLLGDQLTNGWKLLYKQYECGGKLQGKLTVIGVLLPREAPLTAWSGTYAAARQFDAFRSWLAEGQEAAAQERPSAETPAVRLPPEEAAAPAAPSAGLGPDPERPRFILLPILAGAILAAVIMILPFIRKRRRRP